MVYKLWETLSRPAIPTLNMVSTVTLLSGLIIVALSGVSCQEPQTELFSTRTFYDSIRGDGVSPQPGCTPVALWTLIKAGAHYPSSKDLRNFAKLDELRERILDNHNKWHSGDLSEEVLESLKHWTLNVDPSKADHLIESGQGDLISFIERLKSQFPQLLHRSKANSHKIKHNSALKSVETYNIITSALYNTTARPNPGSKDIEETLQSTTCPKWAKVLKNAEAKVQEFRDTILMKESVQNISRRLGFSRLEYDVIKRVYELCSYDRAISPTQSSPWCSIFTPSELKAFEYEEDIESYYTTGPGNPDHALIGCDFIGVFLQNFMVHKHIENVNFHVSSGLLIRGVLASLGVAGNDPPVNSENFENTKSRLWRNSFLTPFNGNIVAVLNECGKGKSQMHTVSLFMNEVPIAFPFCANNRFCEISTFERNYRGITQPSFCDRNIC